MQLRVHRLAVHVDALLGGEPVGDVAPRGAQRRLLQVRLRGQVLQVDARAPRHRVRETEEEEVTVCTHFKDKHVSWDHAT